MHVNGDIILHVDLFIPLGTNKFLLGDEPCQADAAVFGQLSQIYWHSFGNKSYTYLKSKHIFYMYFIL